MIVESSGISCAFRIARVFSSDPVRSFENMIFSEHVPKDIYLYDNSGATAVEGLRGMLDEAGDLVSEPFREKFELEYRRGTRAGS